MSNLFITLEVLFKRQEMDWKCTVEYFERKGTSAFIFFMVASRIICSSFLEQMALEIRSMILLSSLMRRRGWVVVVGGLLFLQQGLERKTKLVT